MKTACSLFVASLLGLACSSRATDGASAPADAQPDSGTSAPGADASPTDGANPAADAPSDAGGNDLAAQLPQVANGGGKVLETPKVVLLSFQGDPHAAELEPLANAIAASSYWAQTTKEYGVGPLVVRAPVHLSRQAPNALTDDDVHTVIANALADASNGLGQPDPSTIYTLLVPYGTAETGPAGATACGQGGFGGYHRSFAVDGTLIPYAVVVECSLYQAPTRILSHEIAEAATDPYVPATPAYYAVGPNDLGYRVGSGTKGSEIGDMCEDLASVMPAGIGQSVTRIWSNAAARAGKNPCLPVPAGEAYFMTVPTTVPDTVSATLKSGATSTGAGFTLAKGQSRIVTLGFLSDGEVAPWGVAVREIDGGENLSLQLDVTEGKAGDVAHLTITANDDTSGGVAFAIDSTKGAATHTYYGVVGVR
jgi:hypothetical protein